MIEKDEEYPDSSDPEMDRLAIEFERLRRLSPNERASELERLARTQPQLAEDVSRLLSFHDDDSRPLNQDDPALPEDVLEDLLEETELDKTTVSTPEAIGPYRVLQLLGSGGMGTVYLADRPDQDFDKKVAIKVLRAEPGEGDLWQRFRAERQILASLEHPNIASLLDGGITPDGRAFVVLEYIEGQDLATWCREKQLDTNARIELFRTVCTAVDHAHRRLVVHRDLKPDNILVDKDGTPKLLDFGIAKLLEDTDLEASIVQTMAGASLLTPEYASPEQIRAESVTTATDVYSLGAVLYELLTDQRAQQFESRRALEIERVVCNRSPTAPSSVAAAKGLRLSKELDAIVAKAMHKEPERRYRSASEFQTELGRFLNGHPITARPDTWVYRTRRFVGRNRLAVGAASIFVLFLIGFSIATAIQAKQIRDQAERLRKERDTTLAQAKQIQEQSDRIREERDVAVLQNSISQEIGTFMVSLFEIAEPTDTSADLVLARDLLDKGRNRIGSSLTSGPLFRAGLMEAMGRAYSALRLSDEAIELLNEAYALRVEDQPTSPKVGLNRCFLANVYLALGEFERVNQLLEQAGQFEQTDSPDALLLRHTRWATQSQFDWATGDTSSALAAALEARAVIEQLKGSRDMSAVSARTTQAEMLAEEGEIESAIALVQEARELRTEIAGADHVGHAQDLRTLSKIYRIASRYQEAVVAAEEALALDRRVLGETHPDVFTDMWLVQSALARYGDDESAIEILRELIDLERQHLGDHPNVALSTSQLATFYSRRRDYETAESLFKEALDLQRSLLPQDHPEIATTLSNLGVLYNRWPARNQEAIPLFQESLEMRRRLFPPQHEAVLESLNHSAGGYFRTRQFDKAEEIYREVLEIRRERYGIHERVAGGLYGVAIAMDAQGKGEEALQLLEESLEILSQCVREDHQDVARTCSLIAKIHFTNQRVLEALDYSNRHLEICLSRMRADAPDVFNGTRRSVDCLATLGRLDEAIEILDRTLAGMRELEDPHPQALSRLESARAQVERARSNPDR
ncbi:MAG: serine/threonine-protein kinase [Planctomycetota bacterium]